jgi:hypothetical protein
VLITTPHHLRRLSIRFGNFFVLPWRAGEEKIRVSHVQGRRPDAHARPDLPATTAEQFRCFRSRPVHRTRGTVERRAALRMFARKFIRQMPTPAERLSPLRSRSARERRAHGAYLMFHSTAPSAGPIARAAAVHARTGSRCWARTARCDHAADTIVTLFGHANDRPAGHLAVAGDLMRFRDLHRALLNSSSGGHIKAAQIAATVISGGCANPLEGITRNLRPLFRRWPIRASSGFTRSALRRTRRVPIWVLTS